jgi:hypothetical protein
MTYLLLAAAILIVHVADNSLQIGLKEKQIWRVTAAVMDILWENPKMFHGAGKMIQFRARRIK